MEDRWAFEVKQDGQRAMVYLPGDGSTILRSRSGADITTAYPELTGLGSMLGRPAVLDGEIVALDREGRSEFERLQSRMGLTSAAKAAHMAKLVPVHLVLFDAVHLDSRSLTGGGVRSHPPDRVNRGRLGPEDVFGRQANVSPNRFGQATGTPGDRLVGRLGIAADRVVFPFASR